jgi:hypothetical protein
VVSERGALSGVLLRVVGQDHQGREFVAGVDAEDGRVVRAAPILWRALMGCTGEEFVACCAARGWEWTAHPYDAADT